MASPPPGHPKRKRDERVLQHAVKKPRSNQQPAYSNAGGSAALLPRVNAEATSPSPAPGSSVPAQPNLTQNVPPTSHNQTGGLATAAPNPALAPLSTIANTSATGKVKAAVTSGLESALRALHISAGIIPPLKPAIAEFVACLDVIQAVTASAEEYNELTSELAFVASTVQKYLNELSSEDQSNHAACERIAIAIDAEVAHIKKQQSRSKRKRALESAKDREDVIKCYRRLEKLFRQLQSNITIYMLKRSNAQHMASLLQGMSPVHDALYDSSYSTLVKRHGCTTETREKVREDLQTWARDPSGATIYWMNGMAGTGKTTIAYSFCEWLQKNQQLGGSFFCSRVSSSCRDVNMVVPTIAYQLAWYSLAFRSVLCKILEGDPSDCKRNIVKQFEKLIQEPMEACQDAVPDGVVIVIDALDECEDDYGVRLILGTLLKLGSNLPLKIFIASRPEPAIRDSMLKPGGFSPAMLHLHDIEQSIVESDIKKYLVESFKTMTPPPSHEQLEQLTLRSGRLFIYAATIVRYILPGRGPANSVERLDAILKTNEGLDHIGQSTKKYKQLDQLYATILTGAFDDEYMEIHEIDIMRLVLWTVICAKEPMATLTLAALLSISDQQVISATQPLLSVLHISELNGLISTLHASFPDYMLDRSRSTKFHCDGSMHNELLANRCFDVMKKQLRFNLCNLESSFVFDEDLPDLDRAIRSNISLALLYACRFWSEHLPPGVISNALSNKLAAFLEFRFLFWMEVMNLTKRTTEMLQILTQTEEWLTHTAPLNHTKDMVLEARDFATRFAASACVRSTPHIYISALPLCSKSSWIYRKYFGRMQRLMDVTGTAINQRNNAPLATWMANSVINCVNYSSNGARIVSGSLDKSIQVWDARTGSVLAGPLQGHTGWVTSVAFSPNNHWIVSGSSDCTVRIWDTRTGAAATEPLQGHTESVESVGFCSDNTCVVSGSNDTTIRVWDARTGDNVVGPLKGHTREVSSVAFSPDRTRIVSGSYDNTIRVWDACTGEPIMKPFEGHMCQVTCVVFSPNGTRIASSSGDATVLVWDACTGEIISGPFKGHMRWVSSIAFSPDGTHIVSASWDRTIRVWNSHTGNTVIGPLEGHMGLVNSVAFSPNGAYIVSSSNDGTIRMWNTRAGNRVVETLTGHGDGLTSAGFSPDGTSIVSGSHDRTIRVWDARTGNVMAGPFKGHADSVRAVAFSPDGTRIASGSDDRTIRVWDALTGVVVAGPFNGHQGFVTSIAFSPSGTHIVSGSNDETIRVWDSYTGDIVVGPFKQHINSVYSVVFSPNGSYIASSSWDEITIWDSHTADIILGPFKVHPKLVSVFSVAFSPDNTRIVSGCGNTIQVWDIQSGHAVTQPFKGHIGPVYSVVFSPDGTHIVSGSEDTTIRIWDAHTGHALGEPLKGHTASVMSVAFSSDGSHLVSCSDDHTIRVWDPSTGHLGPSRFEHHIELIPSSAPSERTYVSPERSSRPERLLDHHTTHDSLALVPLVHPVGALNDDPRPVSLDVYHGDVLPDGHLTSSLGLLNDAHVTQLFQLTREYEVNRNGWIMSGGLPLFCVPTDLLAYIPHPRTSLVIGPLGTLFIDYRMAVFGERWTECYVPQSSFDEPNE